MDLNRLAQQKQQIERINLQRSPVSRRNYGQESFDSTHKRVTTYLHRDVFKQIESLRQSGHITNFTAFINCAIIEYLEHQGLSSQSDCK